MCIYKPPLTCISVLFPSPLPTHLRNIIKVINSCHVIIGYRAALCCSLYMYYRNYLFSFFFEENNWNFHCAEIASVMSRCSEWLVGHCYVVAKVYSVVVRWPPQLDYNLLENIQTHSGTKHTEYSSKLKAHRKANMHVKYSRSGWDEWLLENPLCVWQIAYTVRYTLRCAALSTLTPPQLHHSTLFLSYIFSILFPLARPPPSHSISHVFLVFSSLSHI